MNNPREETIDTSDGVNGDSSIEQVSALASQLGFGSVKYIIEPEAYQSDYYSGRPEFATPGRLPEIGVTGVYGKKETKARVAELALKVLREEEHRRKDIFSTILAK